MSHSLSELAELAGIFAGDGTLYRTNGGHVLEIRGDRKERPYYEKHVKPLFEKVTDEEATLTTRGYPGGCVVGIRCCKRVVYSLFHTTLEFPVGTKSKIVRVPTIICDEKEVWIDYLRGVFDTDGSVYLRRAKTNSDYRQPVVAFASSSWRHRVQLGWMLQFLDFNCWFESKVVRMAGWSTVERFFDLVSPRNLTHLKRYNKFYAGRGSLAW